MTVGFSFSNPRQSVIVVLVAGRTEEIIITGLPLSLQANTISSSRLQATVSLRRSLNPFTRTADGMSFLVFITVPVCVTGSIFL